MNRYSNIDSIEAMNKAQTELRKQIALKEKEIIGLYYEAKSYYTPSNIISSGLSSIKKVCLSNTFLITLIKIVLKFI